MCRKFIFLVSFVLVLCLFGNAWGLVWGQKDIGNPGIPGSASYDAGTGIWTISGSGHDIWGNGDGFYYVFRPLSGNGSLQVNLVSMDVTSYWAKVGPAVRETLESGSKHAMTAMTGTNGIQFVWRVNTDQGSDDFVRGGETWPKELRITRASDELISEFNYEWLPGLFMWTEIGRITIPMNTDVTIGMVVCATNNGALNTAVLDNVVLTAPPYEKPWDLSPADGATVSLTPTLSWLPGDSATSHDVLMGTDPAALSVVATKPLGDESYNPGPLEICTVYYWQIVEQPGDHAGPVLNFNTTGPTIAYNPSPPDGAEEVPLDVVLSWLPGCGAAQHDVYLGTEPAALALVATKPSGDESYNPGPLEICTVYYWRIDGVEADGTTVHTGDVWSFTTKCKVAVDIDIKPLSCPNPLNVKSKGVLPVAILGSEDLDVTTIDVTSIRLAGVAPIRSSYEDVAAPLSDKDNECECTTEGPDGYADLTLKFETQEIVNALGEVVDGEVLALTLTANLSDGTAIEGRDCIIVLSKGGE